MPEIRGQAYDALILMPGVLNDANVSELANELSERRDGAELWKLLCKPFDYSERQTVVKLELSKYDALANDPARASTVFDKSPSIEQILKFLNDYLATWRLLKTNRDTEPLTLIRYAHE